MRLTASSMSERTRFMKSSAAMRYRMHEFSVRTSYGWRKDEDEDAVNGGEDGDDDGAENSANSPNISLYTQTITHTRITTSFTR